MLELRIDVLGELTVALDDRRVAPGQPRQQAVLAVLVMRAPQAVSRAELVDAVWGDAPPTSAEGSLHTYIAALRRLLEPDRPQRAASKVITTTAHGYALQFTVGNSDVREFERLVAAARASRSRGDWAGSADCLGKALRLWRGPALAGVPGPFAETQRARLEEVRLAALEEWAEASLEIGAHNDVIVTLRSEITNHPLRERLTLQLMHALSRSGRQADALEAYRAVRTVLIEQLGIEPATDLQQLHQLILSGADATVGSSHSAPEPQVTRPVQTPHDMIGFIGREAEITDLCSRLEPTPDQQTSQAVVISAIDGTGGIGKTALAVHVAHRLADHYPDGQLFIDLRGFDPSRPPVQPNEAIRHLLAGLGVDQDDLPPDLAGRSGLYRSVLADRQVLVILDNAVNTEQVRPLLPGASTSCVLITSRNRLSGLVVNDGAYRVTLDMLPDADAVELLRKIVGADRIDAEPEASLELVHACVGLPLALRIAGERVTTLHHSTLADLVQELTDERERLDFLETDETTAVRATFSWSYGALEPLAGQLFRLLGLHPGPAPSLSAAAALLGRPIDETRNVIEVLCAGHLIEQTASRRYGFHDLLRAYAQERAQTDDPPSVRNEALTRLFHWYLHSADAADTLILPGRRRLPLPVLPAAVAPVSFDDPNGALAWLDAERTNLVALIKDAASSGLPDFAWRLPLALFNFFERRSHFDDWLDTHLVGLDAATSLGDPIAEARLCNNIGIMHATRRQFEEGGRWFDRALTLWRACKDEFGEGQTLTNLSAIYTGRDAAWWPQAETMLRRAIDIFSRLDVPVGRVIAMSHLATVYKHMDRLNRAIDVATDAVSVARELNAPVIEAGALGDLGRIHESAGDFTAALACHEAALEISISTANHLRQARDHLCIAYVCRDMGNILRMRLEAQRAFEILDVLNPAEAATERAQFGSLLEEPMR